MMSEIIEKLYLAIKSNPKFEIRKSNSDIPMPIGSIYEFDLNNQESAYNNMGATIIDSILQAGMNYERAVRPRVTAFRMDYPDIKLTSDFYKLICNKQLEDIINWKGTKVDRIRELTKFFINEKVENEHQLNAWMKNKTNIDRISKIKGIKDKTVDYLKILAGDKSTIAMDTHLQEFIKLYGELPSYLDYKTGKEILMKLSEKLEIEPATLDYSIWYFMSKK